MAVTNALFFSAPLIGEIMREENVTYAHFAMFASFLHFLSFIIPLSKEENGSLIKLLRT